MQRMCHWSLLHFYTAVTSLTSHDNYEVMSVVPYVIVTGVMLLYSCSKRVSMFT